MNVSSKLHSRSEVYVNTHMPQSPRDIWLRALVLVSELRHVSLMRLLKKRAGWQYVCLYISSNSPYVWNYCTHLPSSQAAHNSAFSAHVVVQYGDWFRLSTIWVVSRFHVSRCVAERGSR